MRVPVKNSLSLVSTKYFNQKIRFSINRRRANQLVRTLKRTLASTNSARAIQDLRDSIYFRATGAAEQESGVTMAIAGLVGKEGATTVSLLLALSLGELKKRKVLYVDGSCDPEKFTIYRELFNLTKIPAEEDDNLGAMSFYSAFGNNLCFLNVSNVTPLDFFSNVEFDRFLGDLKENFDFIIFDMPALNASSETKFLVPRVDLNLLVFVPGRTLAADVERGKKCVAELGGRIDGVILNRQTMPFWARFFGKDAFV